MVEAAVRDVLDGDARGAQQLPYGLGEFGGARGVVANLVVVLGEAPEVVDQRDGVDRAEGEGASSQWAETMRIALGRGRSADQAASSPGQIGSSARGGAPWLR